MIRRAIVRQPRWTGAGEREDWERGLMALLPQNYQLQTQGDDYYVEGMDVMGWTLDAYVIPRLASGNYTAEEVTIGP
jgi:hypothetical protein